MSSKSKTFPYAQELETEITIPIIDRFRILFGSRLFMNTLVMSQWAGECQTKTNYRIERTIEHWFLRLKLWGVAKRKLPTSM